MRGEVEIWRGDDLIHKEPNMLVDGAGELLADIMTVSPSLSGIEDHATSSILDASNYRINAISFGTGSGAFTTNAHQNTSTTSSIYLNDFFGGVSAGTSANVAIASSIDHTLVRQVPLPGNPKAPTPDSVVLQEGCNIEGDQTIQRGVITLSSIFPLSGQLCNFIPSAIASGYLEQYSTAIASDPAIPYTQFRAASLLGAFPDGSSTAGAGKLIPNKNAICYFEDTTTSTVRVLQTGGFFNEVSSMDAFGFVNMVMSSVPDDSDATVIDFSGGASGLCLSAEDMTAYKGVPFVEYTVMLAADDCLFANAYGGITDLGLWTIDMNKSLQSGNTPPFAFSVLNNPRKYKLFCRKGFSVNIINSTDITSYKDMTIKWRIHFR